jgi:hypothetical protein
MLAAVAVRAGRARRIATPAGWRRVHANRARRGRRLAQAVFVRVAGRAEPASYIWPLRARAAASGGLVAYSRVDRSRPLGAHAGSSGGRAGASRARARRIVAPSVRTRTGRSMVVDFFAASARRRTGPPGRARERYDVASAAVSTAAADFVKARPGATGRRVATSKCPRRGRCRAARAAIGQQVVLRSTAAGRDGPGLESPPPPGGGRPPRGRLPSPLPESTGATFYVSTSGSDSNPGTQSAPWRTIQKALDTLSPGQRALVRSGTYAEDLRMDRAGTASDPISVESHPAEEPVLDSAGGHPLEVGSDGGWFRFRGFVIQDHPGTSGGNVDVYGHDVEISSNEIRQGRDQGIYTDEESRNVYVLGNWIHHNGQGIAHQSHGIYLQGADHLVSTNLIHDHPEGFGIQVYDKNSGSIVVNNTVAASGHSGIVIGGSGGVEGIRVHNNIFAFNSKWGIQHDSACPTSTVADHNVLYGNSYAPEQAGCPGIDTSGGNVLTDPRFVDLAARNLHLAAGSSALNGGLAEWALPGDLEGDPRPQGGAPDIGAFEDG